MRRWVRKLGLGALVTLAVLLVLIVGAWLFLTSAPGERLIKKKAVAALNETLPGNIEVGGLDVDNTTLILTDVVLEDPEGNVVARIARLEATLGLRSLLGGEVEILRARIERPQVHLVLDERGLNLMRALQEAKETAPEKDPTLVLRIRDLELSGGEVDFRQFTIDGLTQHIHVQDLFARDELTLDLGKGSVDAQLELDGQLTSPVQGPLALVATLERTKERLDADAALKVGDAELSLRAEGEGTEQARLALRSVRVPDETARAFVPAWPLTADAAVEGTIDRQGNIARLDLKAQAGSARAALTGGVDIARLRAQDLHLVAEGVDFSQLVENGPSSNIALELRASGGGTSLETLDARVDLTVPTATLEDQTVGPIEVHATAQDGVFEVSQLDVKVPGAKVTAQGGGTLQDIRFEGTLTATNLATLGNTLGRIVSPKGLPISGQGTLGFTVSGPPRHPAVTVQGGFSSLQYDDISAQQLQLQASLPDVRRPLDVDANVQSQVLQLDDRRFRDVKAAVVTRGRALTADVTAAGFADVSMHLAGTLDADKEGLQLAELELRYPEARWKLQRPSHIRFGGGNVLVEELTLESGRQRLTVHGGTRGARLDVRGMVENLDLSRLPQAAVSGDLNLSGELDARVKATGTTGRPDVAAQVTLRNGRIKSFDELGLELDARYANDRARGELKARAFQSGVYGNFDLPVRGLMKGTNEPASVDLAIEPTNLEHLFAALGVDPGLSGRAAATLHLSGTAANPHVRIAVDGDHVKQEQGPQGDLDVVVESSKQDGKLAARIDLDTMGGHSFILLKTPFVPRTFIDEEVTGEMFLSTPATLEAAFRDIPLQALAAWGLIAEDFKGRGSLTIDAHGTVRHPKGKIHVALKDAAVADIQPFDAYATIDAGDERIGLTLAALRSQKQLLDVGGSIATSIGAMMEGRDLERVTVSLEGDVGPMRLRELQALTGGGLDPGASVQPDGIVTAHLEVSGPLVDPIADLNATVDQLGVGKAALGKVDLKYRYEDARSVANLALTSGRGGKLDAEGKLYLDLSSRGLKNGVAWQQAPIDARLVSKDFDPSFLSNVTEMVREISGRIDANAAVSGRLGAPKLRGDLEWSGGRLSLMGYGNYRDIHVALTGTNDAIALRDLSVKSGGGKLQFTARADRNGDRFSLTGKGTLEKFPIVSDDQLEAIVSGRLSLQGEATADLVFIRDLNIPEMHVELPEVRRKDLQDLERPDDIVLVRKGEPLYKKRKAEKVAQAATNGGGAAQEGDVAQDGEAAGRRYTFLINAPRNIWVKGTDVNAELGLSEGFRVDVADRALLFGEVRFLRGRVDVLGRRFDVLKDSQVRFAGPAKLPYINITAEHANEREQVAVFTTIRGQGKEVTLKVSSNPALAESEIYTLLATGRRTLKRGSGASMTGSEAASVVGSYAASQVKRVLANKVPVDVLSIEAGAEGLADASVEAGTYLTDKVYLGSVLRLGADPEENENAAGVRLEYQITPRWSFEFEYGTAQRGGADLIWSRDY